MSGQNYNVYYLRGYQGYQGYNPQDACGCEDVADSCGFKTFLKVFRKKNCKLSKCEATEKAKQKWEEMEDCDKDKWRKKGCCPPKCPPKEEKCPKCPKKEEKKSCEPKCTKKGCPPPCCPPKCCPPPPPPPCCPKKCPKSCGPDGCCPKPCCPPCCTTKCCPPCRPKPCKPCCPPKCPKFCCPPRQDLPPCCVKPSCKVCENDEYEDYRPEDGACCLPDNEKGKCEPDWNGSLGFRNYFKLFRCKYPYYSKCAAFAKSKCKYCQLGEKAKAKYRLMGCNPKICCKPRQPCP